MYGSSGCLALNVSTSTLPFQQRKCTVAFGGEEGSLSLMKNEENEEGKGMELHTRPSRPGNFNNPCASLKLWNKNHPHTCTYTSRRIHADLYVNANTGWHALLVPRPDEGSAYRVNTWGSGLAYTRPGVEGKAWLWVMVVTLSSASTGEHWASVFGSLKVVTVWMGGVGCVCEWMEEICWWSPPRSTVLLTGAQQTT